LVSGVEWQKNVPSPQGCQIQNQGFNRFFDLNSDPGVGGHGQCVKQIGHHGTGPVQITPAVAQAVLCFYSDGVKVFRKSRKQGGKQVVVTHERAKE
jgi:hypothetical protein